MNISAQSAMTRDISADDDFFFFASFQLGFLIAHVKLACLIHTKFLQQM